MTKDDLIEAWAYTKKHYGQVVRCDGKVVRVEKLEDAVYHLNADPKVQVWFEEMEERYNEDEPSGTYINPLAHEQTR